jgi:hypothetical protein
MARHPSHILELARKGAELHYQELKGELESLLKRFPHLRRPGLLAAPVETVKRIVRKRRRQKWSAEARKAVSQRMKKYWAAQRAGKK